MISSAVMIDDRTVNWIWNYFRKTSFCDETNKIIT